MPNSIITQDQNGQELFNAISSFFCKYKVGDLLYNHYQNKPVLNLDKKRKYHLTYEKLDGMIDDIFLCLS